MTPFLTGVPWNVTVPWTGSPRLARCSRPPSGRSFSPRSRERRFFATTSQCLAVPQPKSSGRRFPGLSSILTTHGSGVGFIAVGRAEGLPDGGDDIVRDEAAAAVAIHHVDAPRVPASSSEDIGVGAERAGRIRRLRIAPGRIAPAQIGRAVVRAKVRRKSGSGAPVADAAEVVALADDHFGRHQGVARLPSTILLSFCILPQRERRPLERQAVEGRDLPVGRLVDSGVAEVDDEIVVA